MTTDGDDPASTKAAYGARVARSIMIAHPSPSVRMMLALALVEYRPVLLASGVEPLIRRLEQADRGYVAVPYALILCEAQLVALRSSRRFRCCCGSEVKLVVIRREGGRVVGASGVLALTSEPQQVRALIEAA